MQTSPLFKDGPDSVRINGVRRVPREANDQQGPSSNPAHYYVCKMRYNESRLIINSDGVPSFGVITTDARRVCADGDS